MRLPHIVLLYFTSVSLSLVPTLSLSVTPLDHRRRELERRRDWEKEGRLVERRWDSEDMLVKHSWVEPPPGWAVVQSAPPSSDHQITLHIGLKQWGAGRLVEELGRVSDPAWLVARVPVVYLCPENAYFLFFWRYGQYLSKEQVEEFTRPHPDTRRVVEDWLLFSGVLPPGYTSKSPSQTYDAMGLNHDTITLSLPLSQAERLLNTSYHTFLHRASNTTVLRTLSYSLPRILHEHVDLVSPTTYFGTIRSMRSMSFLQPELVRPSEWDSVVATSSTSDTPNFRSGKTGSVSSEESSEAVGVAVDSQPDPAGLVDALLGPVAEGLAAASCNLFVTPACLRRLYNTTSYIPTLRQKSEGERGNVLLGVGVAGYLDQFVNDADLQTFYSKFRPEAKGFGVPTVQVDGGGNDQSKPGVEANLDVQYTTAMSYPIPNIYYSTGGTPPFLADTQTPSNTNEPYLAWLTYLLSQPTLPAVITTSYGDDEQTVPVEYATRGTTRVNPEIGIKFSGGGFSRYFARPEYQERTVKSYLDATGVEEKYAGLFNVNGRAYPDLSAQANGYQVVVGGQVYSVGGTSASSPTVAGIFALLNDYRLSQNRSLLGFINPLIYSGYARGAFNDIVSGNNPGCHTNGFEARSGWDPVTGVGTPDFVKLQGVVVR
ncbi:tripeptidyl peptidase SED3 [Coprinopsis cinerea okayama7|uniref:Tripeptidyl peptidase SED3 n=1 Tax=Coprinopsis cinerea (strain Okayama-7 / 130 / ATCC MYA-4618 / FGSC 9003) TaxID=240176 RepID=A8NAG0_COPC7|nr:tripeptidyl peptidase SED3 [Coprinopsis cinerea okayama7\|eukprot:XP_001831812.2 tripeptidyl peptidase SED3 [Coprinopsis cinerea okayama7\